MLQKVELIYMRNNYNFFYIGEPFDQFSTFSEYEMIE
jgi:hypothetical protein